jgi:hypothetical protein
MRGLNFFLVANAIVILAALFLYFAAMTAP